MAELIQVRRNTYYDSVTLMTLSNQLKKLPGVTDAVVSMASALNKELLHNIGLWNQEVHDATVNDLLIAVKSDTQKVCDEAACQVDLLLSAKKNSEFSEKKQRYCTIRTAKEENEDLNFAIISVAGEYAAREAREALKQNMHVMIFSDHVTEDQELEIKEMAHKKGLMVMGPDCGTAVINGVGLCFANAVRSGEIGLAAASGTGLQEVTVLIDRLGEGISQAIGTGGRDLSAKIGGIMMLDGLNLLELDEETKVIVLVSKPPVKEVAAKIIARVKDCKKPVVVCFIDGTSQMLEGTEAIFAASLEDAAIQAVNALRGSLGVDSPSRSGLAIGSSFPLPMAEMKAFKDNFNSRQKYIRGLYCGGTLAAEAVAEMTRVLEGVYSNVAKKAKNKISNPMVSVGHTVIDLGDDLFTAGRPHPMIEPELRGERLLLEAADPETAVLLMDFELGFGSHSDPVGVTLEAVRKARLINPGIALVTYILGTPKDYQGYEAQKKLLEAEGAVVAQSNQQAVQIAIALVRGEAN